MKKAYLEKTSRKIAVAEENRIYLLISTQGRLEKQTRVRASKTWPSGQYVNYDANPILDGFRQRSSRKVNRLPE